MFRFITNSKGENNEIFFRNFTKKKQQQKRPEEKTYHIKVN